MKRFIIISIVFVNLISCDKYQVVYRGPCLSKPSYYCHNKVKNSYCSKQNNECFCSFGYVTVRERSGVICKPLLSEMKCRFDAECSEITNSSICHPGAGSCTCPSGMIFVSHQNFCRNYLRNSTNEICYHCSRLGGICFSEENLNLFPKTSNIIKSQCSCPFNTMTPNAKKSIKKYQICMAIRVNLGEYCNDDDLICISKNSKCIYSHEYLATICQCKTGYLAVYEKKESHFNCYQLVSDIEYPRCSLCYSSGGTCIIQVKSSRNVVLKCLCDKYQYFDVTGHSIQCMKVTAGIKCQSQKIEICLNIPTNYEYYAQLLDYIRRTPKAISISDAYSHRKNISKKICKMNEYKISYEKTVASLCSDFEINTKPSDHCGISNGNYLNINFVGLYMRVWNQPYIIDIENDFLFDLTCKTSVDQENLVNGQILDRSWTGTGKVILPDVFISLDDTVDMYITNLNGLSYEFVSLQNIQIHFKSFKRKDELPYFLVEKCSEIYSDSQITIYQRLHFSEIKIKHKIRGFTRHLLNSSNNFHDQKILFISSEFQIPNVSAVTNVLYSCIIKLCEDLFWCSQNNYHESEENSFRQQMKHVNVKFIIKQFRIQVFQSNVDQKFVTFKAENRVCQKGSICLSQNQLVILSILTGIFFVLVFVVLTIFFLKKSMAQLIDSSRSTQINQMNYMDISLIPLMDISRSGDEQQALVRQKDLILRNSPDEIIFDSQIKNLNSFYLSGCGHVTLDEAGFQLIPVHNDNRQNEDFAENESKHNYLSTFSSRQTQISEDCLNEINGDDPSKSFPNSQQQAQTVTFVKIKDRFPLIYNPNEPSSSKGTSNPHLSTFIYNNKCACQTLQNLEMI